MIIVKDHKTIKVARRVLICLHVIEFQFFCFPRWTETSGQPFEIVPRRRGGGGRGRLFKAKSDESIHPSIQRQWHADKSKPDERSVDGKSLNRVPITKCIPITSTRLIGHGDYTLASIRQCRVIFQVHTSSGGGVCAFATGGAGISALEIQTSGVCQVSCSGVRNRLAAIWAVSCNYRVGNWV